MRGRLCAAAAALTQVRCQVQEAQLLALLCSTQAGLYLCLCFF